MTNHNDDAQELSDAVKKGQKTLLTVVGALSVYTGASIFAIMALVGYTVTVTVERDAMAKALDQQRSQYTSCVQSYQEGCSDTPVSRSSSDIAEDLESAGFSSLLFHENAFGRGNTEKIDKDSDGGAKPTDRGVYGLLGDAIYGNQ